MTPEEAIKHFEEDLEHTRQHLQDKNKAPEFIEEMKRWEQAEEMAINALRWQAESKKNYGPFATSRIEDAIRDRIWNAGDFAPMKPEEPDDE